MYQWSEIFVPENGYEVIDKVVKSKDTQMYTHLDYPFVSAQVIQDSLYNRSRLISVIIECPRWILAEINTHRVFSRSFASSRAVPTKLLLERVRTRPVIPSVWGLNKPGMQSSEVASDSRAQELLCIWQQSAKDAVSSVEALVSGKEPLHKQFASRLLEPYLTVRGIITSSKWDNFFRLRLHRDAQPEFKLLAQCMYRAIQKSIPSNLDPSNDLDVHLPFVSQEEKTEIGVTHALKVSTARCARVSYNNFDGSAPNIEKDMETYHKLVVAKPIHASPAEHQAKPITNGHAEAQSWLVSNFHPTWLQYRKLLENDL